MVLVLLSTPACDDPGTAVMLDGGADPRDGPIRSDTGPEAGSPDGPSCTAPTPFVPPGQPAGFKLPATRLLVVTQGPANHRGQDVVVAPGAPQLLIGKFAYGPLDKDLKGEEVEVYLQKEPPCGPWVLLDTVVTSNEGQYGIQYGIADDGGRVFYTLSPDHARPPGRYPVRMLVKGDHSVAAFTLFVVQPQTGAVVFDIDGTLTTDDFQLVTQLFSQLLVGGYVPKEQAGGLAVVQNWVAKGYLPVYLTGRPDWLRAISQGWLEQKGYPPGAVHLTDTNAQALPTLDGVAKYKADFLDKLSGEKVQLYAAYGNATTDIQGYEAAKIDKSRTFIIGTNAGAQGTVAVSDYPAHLPAVQAMPNAAVAAPVDTFGW